ncbi:MAG: SDR family oxidoreductase [Chromatiales bacterium]|jgi:3-oxoacyl-[acyl-carrier protein] reductase|nr:SDR family oxidoreductase [Chromatiales bacterium]
MHRFTDKVVLITGATGGIGSATVRRLAAEGARLALTDLAEDAGEFLSTLEVPSGEMAYWSADLTDEHQVKAVFGKVAERFGRLDVLINIAGYDHDNGVALDRLDEANFEKNIAVNLKTAYLCCLEAARLMRTRKAGAIVNMSSLTWRGSPMQFTYSAAKGGVATLTRSLALALGPEGIRVNAVAPALVEVEAITRIVPAAQWEQVRKGIGGTYPLRRIGQPDDIAGPVAFLASDDACFVTGQILEITGGARL